MSFCLPIEESKKFLQALRDGKIVPEKLIEMSSAERRDFFKEIVGEENARQVNAELESKLILKDQKKGMVTWAKKVSGLSEAARKDMLEKINSLERVLNPESERAFLEDLAAKKMGFDVTVEEAQNIATMARDVAQKKAQVPEDSPIRSKERLDYGLSFAMFQEYTNGLKAEATALTWKEWRRSPSAWLDSVGGATKSFLSSLDNSFFGRQGIKVLYTTPSIWAKTFAQSWSDIGKELKGTDAMLPIKADVFSRPNALNGKYAQMKLDVGIAAEEAFPSSLPAKIPLLGRLYRASESAYNGAALRMRADLADKLIQRAESFHVDFRDKEQAQGIGKLVNSMTGRGTVDLLTEKGSKLVNVALFSIKFMKANFDTLTMHRLGYAFPEGPARTMGRRIAAQNLAKIIGTQALILTTAEMLNPGSVDSDPRSSKFGKIKIGGSYFDISGGMAPMVTLASRLVPTMHNGEWGLWAKSGTSGKWSNLTEGKYGQQTALDTVENFFEGKLSPIAGTVRDLWQGHDFQGNKVTPTSAVTKNVTPLIIQTAQQRPDSIDTPEGLAGLIMEFLGLGSTSFNRKK